MQRVPLREINAEEVLKALANGISGVEFASFSVGVTSKNPDLKEPMRSKAADFLSSAHSKAPVKENFDLYILLNLDRGFIEFTPSPVFVCGRYNKFSREIAQTFHYCFKCKGKGCRHCLGTGKLSEHSVQEILEKEFLPAFGASESKFHGCGREDVDVRMLGSGRPFVIELVGPSKRSADLHLLESKINSGFAGLVSISGLAYSGKAEVERIKNTEFEKVYSALCESEKEIDGALLISIAGKEFEVSQRTPERVEKRRPDKERMKKAKIVSAKPLGSTLFSVEIRSSHGLYIKEFISGDNGRTMPSVSGLLGVPCRCKELDVLEICLT